MIEVDLRVTIDPCINQDFGFSPPQHTPLRYHVDRKSSQSLPMEKLSEVKEKSRLLKKKNTARSGGVGIIPGEILEKYTSIYPEKYRPLDDAANLAGVSRYILLESRVPV